MAVINSVITNIEMRSSMKKFFIYALLPVISACSDNEIQETTTPQQPVEATVERSFDFAQLKRGRELFQNNCAACHGAEAQGTSNWQKTDADGKYPPPPLNGTAHAWHHSLDVLKETIKKGTFRIGGKMPPWEGKLSEAEIEDIIIWFQAKWSDEIYTAWYNTHQAPSP